MRLKIQMKPCFLFNVSEEQPVVLNYREKYNQIDLLLQNNPGILDTFHADLKDYGSEDGRNSHYSSEQILRMLIVQVVEGLDYRSLVIRVSESDFLRNFTGIGMGKVMSFGFINGAAKRIGAATWERINRTLFNYAKKSNAVSGESVRVDSTVSESNIHFPTDSSLLWDSYRTLSRLLHKIASEDRLLESGIRVHLKKIKKLHTFISTNCGRQSKSAERAVKRSMKTLIERTEALSEKVAVFVVSAQKDGRLGLITGAIADEILRILPLVKQVTDQSRRASIHGERVPAKGRIFSIFEEHTGLLKRGKAHKPCEFGHLVTLAQTAEKFITYYNIEEQSRHDTVHKDLVLQDHKERFGTYPKVFAADKNYYIDMEDIAYWEERVDIFAVGKKGKRNASETAREHGDSFRDAQRFRAGSEGSISVLKRVFGLRRCFSKGFKSFASSIGCLVFCHNLVNLATG